MRKVISGILGLTVVVGLVVGVAFAVFSDPASLTNMALSVGSNNLLIRLTGVGSFAETVDATGFAELVPGGTEDVPFELQNNSNNQSFSLAGEIPSDPTTPENWTALKGVVECVVFDPAGSGPGSIGDGSTSDSSGWFTLEEWRSASRDLPGDPLLEDGGTASLVLRCGIPVSVSDGTLAGKSLSDLEFKVTGTQL
ncbi:hypothetical protein A3F07_01790 [candidate division WWE3 bacterium RIFCSPHIGHO2_12_FULL_38_15]|uniref:Camelysin metallo-endopeptidase n=1 Tax=candidate division WWE3 bacterium RIFCSPHIGHO2_02_FULL_38_14 TaxID=1802620 RepID=A0A1F4VBP8_UNCKA|nr:MAG: hypothetical protein A2793_04075 [candidate division WWE3 bacterium RIFCSPHIGHO2_01_FULL_38_45]OGC48435.1 MAG: hypothetical protein A3F07_01790 [candidate division WWE3 bacterium RIFCSPHIGHO2_12_FULL_38_15]OGC52865.1 MAG: hypothetical protein A3B64_03560 [candidate division WWE3 bacterium RIFCSPLOWO2_01_FULL_37_24]OGC54370.1 MAG: hypothetical protein A3D91_00540 [candidate division WWE3 bacterium RIFCSPHIGHO2_02_FULL_38_14]HLB51612.1 hypothetical protein [Patescibacteria group bacterium